jgi:MoaA/NifB/PqqE/SkfB family radical SAM enzyme
MCDIWKVKTPDALSVHDVERLLVDLRALGTRRIVLSGGEPLMHPDLFGLCAPLRGAGIGLTLLSSGLLLEPFAARIAATFDDVVVSLDGPAQVHDRIRGVPGAFARLSRGVAALREAAPSPFVSGRCTVQRANLGHLRETVAAARSIGLSRISFLAADTTSAAFARSEATPGAGPSPVAPDADGLAALEAELDRLEAELAADFRSGFVAESPAKLRERIAVHFRALVEGSPFPPSRCNAPWVSAVVEADGSVRPCFFHAAYGRSPDGSGLAELVNGVGAVSFRASLDVASDPTCVRCTCRLNLVPGPEAAA